MPRINSDKFYSISILALREDIFSRLIKTIDIPHIIELLKDDDNLQLSTLPSSLRRKLSKLVKLGIVSREGKALKLSNDIFLIFSYRICQHCFSGLHVSNFIVITNDVVVSPIYCSCKSCNQDKYVSCVQCVKNIANKFGIKLRSIYPIDAWREIINYLVTKVPYMMFSKKFALQIK